MAHVKYNLVGINVDGSKFRPSAWPEMLVDMSAGQIEVYGCHLKIYIKDGVKGIMFDEILMDLCPITFERLISFAKINKLALTKECLGE